MAIHISALTSQRGMHALPVHPPRTSSAAAGAVTAGDPPGPSFLSLFQSPPTAPAAVPVAPTPPPTAESVFGDNPWIASPTGTSPTSTYSMNPYYFATADTAQKVAQMLGGKVVAMDAYTVPGLFVQNQPNQLVELPNGKLINPGIIASFYTHGYSQATVDQMVANEIQG